MGFFCCAVLWWYYASIKMLNLSSYDYDDNGMEKEKIMCRKVINIILDCNDDKCMNKMKIKKYIEYVIRFQCEIFFRNEQELNAKLLMFKFKPFFWVPIFTL
eukprot:473222_1